MSPKIWVLLGFSLVLTGTVPAVAQAPAGTESAARQIAQSGAQAASRKEGDDMVLGAPTAPVTIIEYASLTCSHCAAFHNTTLPQLKEQYIDKGLVKLIFRDFPLDGIALRASMLARCAPPDRYFAFLEAMFGQQQNWARGNDGNQMVENLKRLVRLGGMSEAAANECLQNKAVETAVIEQRMGGERDFKVNATPTLIINGQRHSGGNSFEDLDKVLRPLASKS